MCMISAAALLRLSKSKIIALKGCNLKYILWIHETNQKPYENTT